MKFRSRKNLKRKLVKAWSNSEHAQFRQAFRRFACRKNMDTYDMRGVLRAA